MGQSEGRVWSFAGCQYDDSRLELRVDGQVVDLELKPLEVLHQLLLHAGSVVTKESLLDSVWPGLTVVDSSLATAISKLRKALRDRDATIVVNVPRVGYRLAAAVHTAPAAEAPATAEPAYAVGDRVPRRDPWRLVRSLVDPPSRNVWLAEHPQTRGMRVFKFASAGGRLKSLKREVTVSRFLRESLGERPDIGSVLEWNFESAPYSIESEYGGSNLIEWADAQGGLARVPRAARIKLLADVARAVAAAHDAGVVHKDLKPANILVSSWSGDGGQIRVVDFGSASVVDRDRLKELGITNLGLTQTGAARESSLSGSLMYLAPELFSGAAPAASADIFALGVMLYQLVIGDFLKPLAAGWETDVDDVVLREDIAEAACGDPARRCTSAADLADRLEHIEQRRRDRDAIERQRERELVALRRQTDARIRRPWMVVAAVALLVAIGVSALFYKRTNASIAQSRAVAILPFQNASPASEQDFLRFALPDQIATTLSRMRPLTIRPTATSSQYSGASVDVRKAGRDLNANRIVTGRYAVVGAQLQITIEAVDVDDNRLLWRDTVNIPSSQPLALQSQISALTRGKLATALGATDFTRELLAPSKNGDAYNLYLQTVAMSYDPGPNKDALTMLERVVTIDPTYAAGWYALSSRAYADSRFGTGGPAMLDRSDRASERALTLDPDYVDAAAELVLHRAERGNLATALQQASDLVRRRPDSAQAHHLFNYALRYAGLLDEAGRQCDEALLLDPQTIWGSCSSTFMELGQYLRAKDFVRKDLSSEWSKAHAVEILVREGKRQEAMRIGAPQIAHWDSYKMLLACVEGRPPSEIASLSSLVESSDDPEVNYFFAAHLAYCAQPDAAVRYLKMAIDGNYCSFPAIDRDPLFDSIRKSAAFAVMRAAAIACRDKFAAAARPAG